MDIFLDNLKWVFSGIGVFILGIFLNYIRKREKSEPKKRTKINLKDKLRILFIDDEHTKFKTVSILKKAGWKHTKSVKDITDLDDYRVKEAHFIFVDINGVGKTLFDDQGLGLASALKDKYPQKKIILYSAETKGDRFHEALRKVDTCLEKDADPYQFMNLLETLS